MTTTTLILLALVAVATPALGSRLPYIIGGTTVTDNTKYAWQGSLQVYSSHNCGCALISKEWAVTAGHCVGNSPSNYRIRFGTVTWNSGGQLVTPTDVFRHENYGNGVGSFPNDIAVMKFPAVILGSTVKAITIVSGETAGNSDCHITGWGYTTTGGGGGIPIYLQEANINVYTNAVCRGTWGNSINDGHVCIGDSANGRGSCNGDSGGPLVCKVGGSYQLVGVTSWGINGCYTSFPSVYTRLTYFRSWIRGKTGV